MKFAVNQPNGNSLRDRIAEEIIAKLQQNGHTIAPMEAGAKFVLNLTNIDAPQPFQRKSQAVFVVSLAVLDRQAEDIRSLCYTALVKTLSNIMLCIVPSEGRGSADSEGVAEIYFTTPEVGFYHYPFDPARVYQSMLPIISSHLVIRNRLTTDLLPARWEKSPVVEDIKRYGRELDRLGVLPSPFSLREVLGQESIDHLYQMFEVKGISYGNLSTREIIPEMGGNTFWMTARGVNKARLSRPGKDMLLVTGHNEDSGEILVSVPPDHDPKVRVSVDAIEHLLIYRTFPEVGAIVHVHAWMDDVLCTRQNYPCGTQELAEEVVELLKQTGSPDRAVIGLKNHGLTITGPDLADIFNRIRGRLQIEVPMFE